MKTAVSSVPSRIVKRARSSGRGSVFTPNDFLDLGGRDSIDQALSRLAKAGRLRRLARGSTIPQGASKAWPASSPAPDDIAQALARETGSQVQVAGSRAANVLGLSTQVPARSSYLTDGPSRRVVLGKRIVDLRHASPKISSRRAVRRGLLFRRCAIWGYVTGGRYRSCRVAPAVPERQEKARLDGRSGSGLMRSTLRAIADTTSDAVNG